MRNLMVADISVCETPILQAGISLIKDLYQNELFLFASQNFIEAFRVRVSRSF